MKKLISLLSIATVLFALVSGCVNSGSPESASSAPDTTPSSTSEPNTPAPAPDPAAEEAPEPDLFPDALDLPATVYYGLSKTDYEQFYYDHYGYEIEHKYWTLRYNDYIYEQAILPQHFEITIYDFVFAKSDKIDFKGNISRKIPTSEYLCFVYFTSKNLIEINNPFYYFDELDEMDEFTKYIYSYSLFTDFINKYGYDSYPKPESFYIYPNQSNSNYIIDNRADSDLFDNSQLYSIFNISDNDISQYAYGVSYNINKNYFNLINNEREFIAIIPVPDISNPDITLVFNNTFENELIDTYYINIPYPLNIVLD